MTMMDVDNQQMSQLKRKARKLGVSPEIYLRHLIETGLALDDRARSTPFHLLAGPIRRNLRGLSEQQLDQLVEKARNAHHSTITSKRRRTSR